MVEEQIDLFLDGRRHAKIGVVVGFLLTTDFDDGLQDGEGLFEVFVRACVNRSFFPKPLADIHSLIT
ncbi:hypothetical protein GK047_25110 [Paenibacillus sp. SYP-B3998]|uniref:Uncharacterized protein n=2 Tax=Paenibacillus sp. SYP-B3998 TaxID=2678564 RepID=A0A6G4A416_9BACL|nr:hypothetical protein [Paenibacillus sp. SYP-B3998]